MICPPTAPDHGLIVMWTCFGAAVGLLVGKLLSDLERKDKPPP